MRALRHAGLQHRVALVGFDDIVLADMVDPGLTVVAQDPVALGVAAAGILFRRLDGDASPPQCLVIDVELVARGSGEIPAAPGRPTVIVVCGEALIDLISSDGRLEPMAGGGPLNTAVALGRLGVPVGFLSALSTDAYGRLLERTLDENGVDLRYVLRTDAPTTLAVAHVARDGDAEYTFDTSGTAYTTLRSGEPAPFGHRGRSAARRHARARH